MNWTEAAAHYRTSLKSVLNVRRHALHVAEIKTTGVSDQLQQTLVQSSTTLQRQLERLEKGEFRIAVVGLEKAGKSTFVNAWLEADLLPTDSKRCTYTTTQIYSVTDDKEQRLEIIAKSREKFVQYQHDLQAAAQGNSETAKRAREDLEIIRQQQLPLEKTLQEGNKIIPFLRIEEIAHYLRKYVADVSVAHAIEEVRLYTTRLAETDGIVFFDVPGLNSGLGKHLEESRTMLADCDAVICVQYSRRPSLEAHEQKLVEFVHEGDEAVGIAGKLFVFAGQADLHGSAASLQQALQEIAQEWQRRGKLPPDHIIPGSAAGYLLLTGVANTDLHTQVGTVEELKRKVRIISNLPAEADSTKVLNATGIPAMRQRIKRYLNEERVTVLQKRCDDPMQQMRSAAQEIYRSVRQRFSENPDEARRQEANRRNILFQTWWANRWEEIEPAVNRFFREHFDPDHAVEEIESVQQLRVRYQELVHEGLAQLPTLDSKRRQDIFDRESRPVFDALIANDAWRAALYEDVNNLLHTLAEQLSIELLKDSQQFIDYMSSLLWNSAEVAKQMYDQQQLQLQLESGLRTLFLRFARPVTEALIRAPLASDRRKEIVRKLGYDIELLDNYYEGEEPAYERLKRYVKYGNDLLENPLVRQAVLGISPTGSYVSSSLAPAIQDIQPKPAVQPNEVIAEVQSDLVTLETYLTEVVFSAAGFEVFVSQELKRLRDRFASLKHIWAGVAINEYEAENPLLLAELPADLKMPIFDLEISERLRQLRLALEEAKEIEVN